MKIITLFLFLLLIACTSKDIAPTEIVGKWAPTYMLQSKNADGTWGDWTIFYTLVALPVIEFTSDGRYLTDGKPGANCCDAGNNYHVANSEIIFSNFLICPIVKCGKPENWIITEIKEDTLILEKYFVRSKHIKIK
jgi:hypothetical protein